MIKFQYLLLGLLMTIALNAQSGAKVYEAKCALCHQMKPMMDKEKMMAMTPQERMSMKEKMMKTMKAPPMSKVSAKVKFELKDDKAAFVAFVKDYIVNPSAEKSHCMPMALKKFGVMPAIGKSMKAEEIDAVANWLHDNFTNKWNPDDMGMMCKVKGKGMKCGEGKCGGKMKTQISKVSKCGASHQKESAGKCGNGVISEPTSEEKTMKCGQGKCGGKM